MPTNHATHVAGAAVGIGHRIVQRCGCCGEKLLDNKSEMAQLNSDGTQRSKAVYSLGALVRVTPTGQSSVGDFGADELPDDFCLALVE